MSAYFVVMEDAVTIGAITVVTLDDARERITIIPTRIILNDNLLTGENNCPYY